jgi:hypothetical protein
MTRRNREIPDSVFHYRLIVDVDSDQLKPFHELADIYGTRVYSDIVKLAATDALTYLRDRQPESEREVS